jgi:hypothetical protein
MASKTNTRKAGFKKVEASCSKKAKKTLKVIQKNRPLSSKIYKQVTNGYIKSCTKEYTFKNGKWVPKCDETAEKITKSIFNAKKANGKKAISKSERQSTYNSLKKDCLKEYTLK